MSIERIFYFGKFFLMFSLSFTFVIYGPFLRSMGFTIGEMAFINGAFQLLVVGFDLPTSFLADRFGRTRAYLIGYAFLAAGLGWYVFMHTVLDAVIAEVLAGIGIGFITGSLESWLKTALTYEETAFNNDAQETHKRIQHRHDYAMEHASKATTSAKIIGGVIGGLLAHSSYRLPFVVQVVMIVIVTPFLGKWMTKHEPRDVSHDYKSFKNLWHEVRNVWRQIRGVAEARWFLAAALVASMMQIINFFWAVAYESWIGQTAITYMWIFMQLALFLGARGVHRLSWRKKDNIALNNNGYAASVAGLGLSMWLMGFSTTLIGRLAGLMLFEVSVGAREQLFYVLSARHVDHRILTTYRSLSTTALRLGIGIMQLTVWFFMKRTVFHTETIVRLWTIIGTIMIAGTLLLALFRPPMKQRSLN